MHALSPAATAAIVFYTSESAWNAAVENEAGFDFTSSNVALADEVTSAPGANDGLGGTLTFSAANTGLTSSFTLITLESGAGFTFEDNEGSSPEWDQLSVGDIDNFENDDWQITFGSSDIYNFGFLLQDNNPGSTGESFSVFDTSDNLLGTFTSIPKTDGIDFVGVTSSNTGIGRVVFDEDAGGDDTGLGGIRLSATPVPEPSSTLLFLVGLGLTWLGRGRSR